MPTSDDSDESPGTSSPDRSTSPGSSRSSSPTGDESMDLGEDESGEGGRSLPPGTDIELKKMFSVRTQEEEALSEEKKISIMT